METPIQPEHAAVNVSPPRGELQLLGDQAFALARPPGARKSICSKRFAEGAKLLEGCERRTALVICSTPWAMRSSCSRRLYACRRDLSAGHQRGPAEPHHLEQPGSCADGAVAPGCC
ncbi:unnamed protein product [Effrenium voratum]|nr:unnamed protein product [Effrenium voratum]